jgi:hypothetical protein
MSSSEKEYIAERSKREKRLRMIVTWISIISFFGSSAIAVVPTLLETVKGSPAKESQSTEETLKQQAQGYEAVLQQEPDNQTALRELVNIRIKLQDSNNEERQKTIALVEKLIKLNPENQEYKTQLEVLKKEQK